jgi:hypothetical protein
MKRLLSLFWIVFTIGIFLPLASIASVSDDQHWDNQFGPTGVNGQGNAYGIAVIGNKVYVDGFITAAGNTKANTVAGFDGTNWFQLNSGLLGYGALALSAVADNGYLYVGGIFTNADDPTAIDTARWDGTNWAGIGIQGLLITVKRNGNNVYFGGDFSGTTSVVSTNIIGWDGTNWFALGTGLGGTGFNSLGSVNCIAFQGSNVYAGGNFSYAGTSPMTNVAYWDGSAWHALGNPFNSGVYALQFLGGYLYAGGGFTNASLQFTNIARWDGSTWSAVPGGAPNRAVSDFATDGTNLFVCGGFTSIGGVAANFVASFDGSNWTPLNSGLHWYQNGLPVANRLCWASNQLYVTGGFDRADNVGADNVARWDGSNWWNLGGSTSKGMGVGLDFVQCLFILTNSGSVPAGLYAGGPFPTAGSTNANCVAYFDGTNWNALGAGISGSFFSSTRVSALTTDGTYLYAGGNFTNAGAYTGVGGIAAWDGNNWNPLYYGLDGNVNALTVDGYGYVWVGGAFTNINYVGSSKGLAQWNSGSWYSAGAVDGTNAIVDAIAYDGGTKVYVGGQFYSVGGVATTNIAYYDYNDGLWHALGLGLNTRVNALGCGNGILYAGGTFAKAGSLAVNRIAQWDGSSWAAMGSGITGASLSSGVNSIAIVSTNVYVAGNFTNAGGIFASNVAVWNGLSWSALGSGTASSTSPTVNAIAAAGNDVYIGGQFTFAGDKPAQFIAHWNSQSNYYPAANMKLTRAAWQANRQFRFRVTGTSGQDYIIQSSTNFSAWMPLQTNSTMFYDFSDPNSTNYPSRSYRTVLAP